MLIVTPKQMEDIEQAALEFDLTMPRLMENAGSAAAAYIRRIFPVENISCLVFSGPGNNGGDGIVVARKLQEYGASVILVLVDGEPVSPQARHMYDFLNLDKVPILSLKHQRALVEQYVLQADLIVDAIYGIGFRGTLTGQSLIACEMINHAPAAVVALDCPTGISANQGVASYGAIEADFTVVFQLLKPLHILPSSLSLCGTIELVDIGIPLEAYQDYESQFTILTERRIRDSLPRRPKEAHKGSFGRLTCIGGSSSYRGAPLLATLGALRTGVGICSVLAPQVVCASVANQLPEPIFQSLPTDTKGALVFKESLPLLEKELAQCSAVLFGPGAGQSDATCQILIYLLKYGKQPLVLDGDALTLLADHKDLLKSAKCPVILTPHPGEMAALLGRKITYVQENRLTVALDFSTEYNVITILKGFETVIATPEGRIFLNDTGNTGLATGGSGDLLAGMVGSFLAQGSPPHEAAFISVWLHGAAADLCANRLSQRFMLPHDLLEDLSRIFLSWEQLGE